MQDYVYPSSSTVTISAIGTNDVLAPSTSIQVAGQDPGGILRPLSVDTAGVLNVTVTASALPTGAATEATLAAMSAKLPSPLGAHVIAASLSVNIASDQVVPISAASLPLPAGAATAANQTSEIAELVAANSSLNAIEASVASIDSNTPPLIGGLVPVSVEASVLPTGAATESSLSNMSAKFPINLGQKLMSGSMSVVIASDQSAVPVSGTVTVTGGATAANQATEIASLASIDSKLTSPLAVTGPLTDAQLRATPVPVSGTIAVTGVATAANQATEIASLASLDAKAVQGALNYGAASGALRVAAQIGNASAVADFGAGAAGAQTLRVVQATGGAAPSASSGRAVANAPVVNDYTVTPVTSAAYVQLIASTTLAANVIEIFDSSGYALYLAVGAAASEINQFIIYPGGNGQVPLAIPAGSRVSIKAVSTSATAGFITVNLYT